MSLALLASVVHQVPLVLRAPSACVARLGKRVQLDPLGPQVPVEMLALRVLLVIQDRSGPVDLLVCLVRMARMVSMV